MDKPTISKIKDQTIYEYKDYRIYMEEHPEGFGHRHTAIVRDSSGKKLFKKSFYKKNHSIDEVLKLMINFVDVVEKGYLF